MKSILLLALLLGSTDVCFAGEGETVWRRRCDGISNRGMEDETFSTEKACKKAAKKACAQRDGGGTPFNAECIEYNADGSEIEE